MSTAQKKPRRQNMKTKVIEVKELPVIKKIDFAFGVRDKAAAEMWGQKYGYSVVYYLTNRQRVYADKLQVRVDQQAEDIETASAELVAEAAAWNLTSNAV
jgi:hypothetical protein